MSKPTKKQYTIRNIPPKVDSLLKRKSRESGKSFNQVALDALTLGSGQILKPKRDFSKVIGSLSEQESIDLEAEILRQRQIDHKVWK